MTSRITQTSNLGNFRPSTAKSSTLGVSYLSPSSLDVWPQKPNLMRRSIPARAAILLNVCLQAWFGLMPGSVTPSALTHSDSLSLDFAYGRLLGSVGSSSTFVLPSGW
jgi:hypothetical protein